MGKSSIRCLPPLVYGKLTGACEFVVEKVEVTDKKLKKNCKIVIKILWWGETKPLILRPKRIQFITEDNQQVITDEKDEYSVKYEVRTKPKLFMSYLEKCEVTELIILNALQNEIIGSTFLRDLNYLIFNNKFFSSPIISDSGNSIGKITCQFIYKATDLLTSPVKDICSITNTKVEALHFGEWNSDDLKLNLNLLDICSSRDESLNKLEENKTMKHGNLCSSATQMKSVHDFYKSQSPNAHHNTPVTDSIFKLDHVNAPVMEKFLEGKTMVKSLGNSDTCLQDKDPKDLMIEIHSQKTNECATVKSSKPACQSNCSAEPKVIRADLIRNNNINKIKKSALPNRKNVENTNKNLIVSNFSKSVNKKAVTSKVKSYIESKSCKNVTGPTDKTIMNSKKLERETMKIKAAKLEKNVNNFKSKINPTGNVKNFLKVSNEISKLNKLYLNSKKGPCETHSDLEQEPVKENAKAEMSNDIENEMKNPENSKKDEESVNNSKPNITENNLEKLGKNKDKINVDNRLYFDLSDPVEKIYYETFFLETETLNKEFEIAELLNQPENRYILDIAHERDKLNKNALEEDVKRTKDYFMVEKTNDSEGNNGILNENNGPVEKEINHVIKSNELDAAPRGELYLKENQEFKTDCSRCKYYKKVSELDKIIEALKNFEARLKSEVMTNENICDGDQHLLLSRSSEHLSQIRERNSDEVSGGTVESNFSKEDSDFIEFTHYLSQR